MWRASFLSDLTHRQDQAASGERDFDGEKRSNATRASTTDPEAQLYRRVPGKEAAQLCVLPLNAANPNRSRGPLSTWITKP